MTAEVRNKYSTNNHNTIINKQTELQICYHEANVKR